MNLIKLIIACFLFVICANPLLAAPVITSLSPSNGDISGGNVITINGSGFSGATAVNFGFRPATSFNVITDNSISAIVPAGTAGTVDITVTAASQISAITRADFYTYTEDSWRGLLSGIIQDAVVLFDTATNTIEQIIPQPGDSIAVTINPDGTTIYVANGNQARVTVIDAATNTIIATIPTSVGPGAFDIIVSPDGKRVYVPNNISGFVTVIDTATNTELTNIFIAPNLGSAFSTPDGSTLYVGNFTLGNVTTINTATNTVGVSIATGNSPGKISITPDGTRAYVANLGSDTVSIIDTATNTVINTIALPVGSGPYGSFILPNGKTMYVANINNSTVSVVDLTTNSIVNTIPFPPGSEPFWVVSTPDGKKIYVINGGTDDVTPIDVATNTIGPSFANLMWDIQDISMSADQAPVAAFFVNTQPVGFPSIFDASASISPIGIISSYAWDFGDGTTLITATPIVSHTYTSSGSFNVVLTVTNSAGTSIFKVYSSGFMSKNGGPNAILSQMINIPPSPPTDVKGFQKSCRYPTQTDLINVIQWSPPSTGELPVAYQIYRDAAVTELIAIIPGNGVLKFEDHNRKKKQTYTYFLVSVNATGAISSSVSVTINPKK